MVGMNDESSAEVSLSASPNPAKGATSLKVGSPLAATARLSLFSASGQLLRQQGLALSQGINRFPLDLSAQPPGLYWLKLSTAAGVQVLQLVVL